MLLLQARASLVRAFDLLVTMHLLLEYMLLQGGCCLLLIIITGWVLPIANYIVSLLLEYMLLQGGCCKAKLGSVFCSFSLDLCSQDWTHTSSEIDPGFLGCFPNVKCSLLVISTFTGLVKAS